MFVPLAIHFIQENRRFWIQAGVLKCSESALEVGQLLVRQRNRTADATIIRSIVSLNSGTVCSILSYVSYWLARRRMID